jgi:hypothetical protein
MQNRNLRLMNVVLGFLVLISSFVWRRNGTELINAWVTGLVVILSALLAIRRPQFRYVSAAAGVWLIASLFAFPNYASPAVWLNIFIGAAIALVALIDPHEVDVIAS